MQSIFFSQLMNKNQELKTAGVKSGFSNQKIPFSPPDVEEVWKSRRNRSNRNSVLHHP
jgi:hypothetical protein